MAPETIVGIFLALCYAFLNGANDRANSIATIIRTKALSPTAAIALAGILNFVGPFLSTAVAKTLAKGIVPQEYVTLNIVLGGLAGAVACSWLATWKGLPISITHALVGGVMGSGIARIGFSLLRWDVLVWKIFVGIIFAPIIGFIAGVGAITCIRLFVHRLFPRLLTRDANTVFRNAQIGTSCFLSISHGMNDGQNAIAMLALIAFASGMTADIQISWLMIFLGSAAIGFGSLFAGWRVIRSVGWKITRLEPVDGCAAETAAAAVILGESLIGVPISTTHVSVSAILGVGARNGTKRVNWRITKNIVLSWFFTIPLAAVFGFLGYFAFSTIFP